MMAKENNSAKIIDATPNYKRIYSDIISMKYPEKMGICNHLLKKNNLSTLDIIEMSQILFNKTNKENFSFDQKHRSYDRFTILKILEYQKKNELNNSELARHFNLSRNTVSKWKNRFLL
ncbi:DNA-binding transcriptional regulator YiaG [Chryseobacterium ginsenosidimutans]|uniref:helix-turn-helix domain-containing protein n=1 Tax=Chryseobacterium ginsenosidimutans TaxID=687846 RepID=UPI00278933B4|nr:helix-turn-helix domain-containing protein [Chryseobacterium ginsenosidimutans]MDQ0593905.1 DNA-binding transcriptional regulator YiaG [Chryseobacterium ginsenosidimutans]